MQLFSRTLVKQRAQGTIEYLVILAVIVVIGLVVVSLLSNLMNTSNTVRSTHGLQSKIGFGGISVIDSAADLQGDAVITAQNISGEDLVITQIIACGEIGDYGLTGQRFVAGSTVNFTLNGTNLTCTGIGDELEKRCDIVINSESIYNLSHSTSGVVYFSCVPNVTVNGTVFSAQAKRPIITMFSPTQPTFSTSSTIVDFNFSVADENSAISSCVLRIDGVDKNTLISPSVNQLYSLKNTLSVGTHDWNITCIDLNNNIDSEIGTVIVSVLIASVDGVCGTAINQGPFQIPPSSNLCSAGTLLTPPGVVINSNTYTWTCEGSNGGANASCSVSRDRGAGTLANPYLINTCQELADIDNHLSSSYKLLQDINFYSSSCSSYRTGSGWTSIGGIVGSRFYTGTFDGNGKNIIGLFEKVTASNISCGLFSVLNTTGKVTNVNLIDANISCSESTGVVVGSIFAGEVSKVFASGVVTNQMNELGGIAGSNGGLIHSCYSDVNVIGDLGSTHWAGGLTGLNMGAIINSYSKRTVIGVGDLGGLVGYNYNGAITNSYSITNIIVNGYPVGGLVGRNYGVATITNSFSAGSVSDCLGYSCWEHGGLIGNTAVTISNSYWDGTRSGIHLCDGDGTCSGPSCICTEKNASNNEPNYFYSKASAPISSWGTWQNISGAKWNTSDGNWSICEGQNYPWLTWENKSC